MPNAKVYYKRDVPSEYSYTKNDRIGKLWNEKL
jgi:hypothetical protein